MNKIKRAVYSGVLVGVLFVIADNFIWHSPMEWWSYIVIAFGIFLLDLLFTSIIDPKLEKLLKSKKK